MNFTIILLYFISLLLQSTPQTTNDQVKIISVSPQGSTTSIDQTESIVVLFNKPMVALRTVADDIPHPPLQFVPDIDGRYRWLGASTLIFTPSDTLPFATGYRATIPAGTEAIDGSRLRSDYTWTFESLRPDLVASIPASDEEQVRIDKPVYLFFNQPVDSSKAVEYIRFQEFDGISRKDVAFDIRYPSPEEMNDLQFQTRTATADTAGDRRTVLVATPMKTLSKGRRYAVVIREGLSGIEGPLGSIEEKEIQFITHRRFVFERMESREHQSPDREIHLQFTTPVQIDTLIDHLTFEPAITIPEYYSQWSYSTNDIYLNLDLLPDTTYALRIDKTLTDIFEQTLDKDIEVTFTTASYRPQLRMVTGQGLIEAYNELSYTVSMLNIDTLRIRTAAIPADSIIPVTGRRDFYYNTDRDIELKDIKDTSIVISHTPNQWKRYTVDLKKSLGSRSYGAVFLEASHRDHLNGYTNRFPAVIQITGLGLTAKYSPENTFVWVTRLRDTQPVNDAQVELRDDANNILWSGKTDGNGMVTAPGWGTLGVNPENRWSSPRLWVFVHSGDDFTYTRNEDGAGIEPWRFGIPYDWRPQFRPLEAAVFTERGMYRAGEEVSIKGIVRKRIDDSWQIPSDDDSLYVTIRNPRNDVIYRDSLTVNEFGSISKTIQLEKTAPTGAYRIELSTPHNIYDDEEEYYDISFDAFAYGQFRVEAFRPAEFSVNVHPLTRELLPGDTLQATVSARYLFGAPMKNDRAQWQIIASPGSFTQHGYPGYTFSADWDFRDEYGSMRQRKIIANEQTTLDENGTLAISQATPVGMLSGPHTLQIESTVHSVSRRSITGAANVLLHGGTFYAGIKRSSTFLSTGDSLQYDIISVAHDGAVSPGRELTVRIIKREWSSVRQAAVGGRYRWVTERIDSVYYSRDILTSDEPVSGVYTPDEPGLYFITAEGYDERGNTIRSSAYFYVSGSGYVAWRRSDDDRIDLVADAASYKPGETARVIIQSPYESARALITIERDGIMEQWTELVHGSAPVITIPIAEDHLPNIFVSALLIHGRVPFERHSPGLDDVGKPSFKIGYINLPVDAGTRRLNIDVTTDKETYRPGDPVYVHIFTRDAAEKAVQSEVALSVADAGVLNLINYRITDPFDTFYGSRRLAVSTSQTLAHLVDQRSYGEKGEDEGGGGGLESMAGMETRGDFRFTAYWNPSVVTGDDGKATVRFKLPDNLTEFKVMASGQTKNSSFGYGESSFNVNKELLLQPALPRFVRIDDKFEGGVVVTNFTDTGGTVTVTSNVAGSIQSEGSQSSTIRLRPGESMEVRFAYSAATAGEGIFTFTARMNDYTDAVSIDIPVQRPVIRESVAMYESTTDRTGEAIIIPGNIHRELGGLEISAASSALVGLENSIDYLLTYPYGCLEQQLSGILPIILSEDMVRAFDLKPLRGSDLRGMVHNVLNQLDQFQTDFGGFALWRGNRIDSPYISAYTLYVMGEAEKRGYSIDSSVRDRGIEYIRNYLRNYLPQEESPYTSHTTLAAQALSVYALSLFGINENAYVEQLYRQRNELPLFAKAFLIHAIANTSNDTKMIETINQELMNTVKVDATSAYFEERNFDGLEWTYSSNLRTTAIILEALLAAGVEETISQRVVRWLLDERKDGRWRSTQENVYTVKALAAYFETYESIEPDFTARIAIEGRTVLKEMFTSYGTDTKHEEITFETIRTDEQLPIDISVDGTGRLYYGIRMNYFPKDISRARDEGLTILKSIIPLDGDNANGSKTYSAGTVYKITITVISPHDRHFVVVNDPLPGGFEPVNVSFTTESTLLGDHPSSNYQHWWGSFNHIEQYDDRVLLFADKLYGGVHTHSYLVRAMSYGTFNMPPTHSEQMYAPEVFGRTAPGIVMVE